MRTKGAFTSMEALCLNTFDKGESFFTSKKDKDVTAIAWYYKRSVITERLAAIDTKTCSNIEHLTKVTLTDSIKRIIPDEDGGL